MNILVAFLLGSVVGGLVAHIVAKKSKQNHLIREYELQLQTLRKQYEKEIQNVRNQSVNRNRELINGEAEKRPAPPLSENDTFNTSTASKERAYSVEEIRQKHSRAYEAWTDQEEIRGLSNVMKQKVQPSPS